MALAGRVQIIQELLARVNSLAWVGGVVENGGDDRGLAAALKDGKCWVTIMLSDDEIEETPNERGAPLALFGFEALLLVFWPANFSGVPETGEDAPKYVVAAQIHSELQKKILGVDEDDLQLGYRCRYIDCIGGGSAGFAPEIGGGLNVTSSRYQIWYAHDFNKPEVLK